MKIEDISDASFGERFKNFYQQYLDVDQALAASKEEMLDEIHTMLRHLTKDAKS